LLELWIVFFPFPSPIVGGVPIAPQDVTQGVGVDIELLG
jgi:hypothetical protein